MRCCPTLISVKAGPIDLHRRHRPEPHGEPARTALWVADSEQGIRMDAGVTWLKPIGHYESAVCGTRLPREEGQDRPVNDSVVPTSGRSAVSPSGHPGRCHPDGVPRDAIPRFAPGAALIVALLLSAGLWSLIWLAVSALAAMRPW